MIIQLDVFNPANDEKDATNAAIERTYRDCVPLLVLVIIQAKGIGTAGIGLPVAR
jgi:hypothetical protein